MELLSSLLGLFIAASDLLVLYAAYTLVAGLIRRDAARRGLGPDAAANWIFWVAVGAVSGARLAAIAPYWAIYVRYPLDILRVQSGLSFHGAVVGALIAAAVLARRSPVPVGAMANLLGLYVPVGIALQRLGCVVRSECFGASVTLPSMMAIPGVQAPRYPAELIEAALVLSLSQMLRSCHGASRPSGELAFAALAGYGLLRAGVDALRVNLFGWPSADQLASLAMAAAATIAWWWIRIRATNATDALPPRTSQVPPVAAMAPHSSTGPKVAD